MIRPVLKMGEPLLLQRAKEVIELDTPQLHALINDMKDTMREKHGVGIAAPQIGVSLRVVMFEVTANPSNPAAENVPYTVLINPILTPLSLKTELGWEGCLSVPGLRGVVPRYQHLRYQGVDQFGNPIDRNVSGFHARVVQHEYDHLEGILYPMRIEDMQTFGFTDVLLPEITPPSPSA